MTYTQQVEAAAEGFTNLSATHILKIVSDERGSKDNLRAAGLSLAYQHARKQEAAARHENWKRRMVAKHGEKGFNNIVLGRSVDAA